MHKPKTNKENTANARIKIKADEKNDLQSQSDTKVNDPNQEKLLNKDDRITNSEPEDTKESF